MLPVEDLQAVYKSQLMELIEGIDIIAGIESLGEKE
jgi:hypothetical protein